MIKMHILFFEVMHLNKSNWKPYVYAVIIVEAIGALSSWLTKDGMEVLDNLPQSVFTPPDIVFPIVWAVLYALMGIGISRIWLLRSSDARSKGIWLFIIQLIFNFLWSIVFFNFRGFGFALIWLLVMWILIIVMIVEFFKVDKPAAWMQIPYVLWVTFAAYLNYVTWMYNR